MQCRGRERSFGYNLHAIAAGIQLFPPTDVGLVSGFLRTDVGVELFVYTLAIDAQIGAMVTVTVVFNRAASVEINGIEVLRHLHLHTETEHRRYLGILIGCHLLGDFNGTLVVDDILQIKFGRNGFHVVFGCNLYLIVYGSGSQADKFQSRVFPYCKAVLQAGTHIIIGRSTPEVGGQCSAFFNHFQPIDIVFAQVTVGFVELNSEVLTFHNQVVSLVVDDLGSNDSHIGGLYILQLHGRSLVGIQSELVFGNCMTGSQ